MAGIALVKIERLGSAAARAVGKAKDRSRISITLELELHHRGRDAKAVPGRIDLGCPGYPLAPVQADLLIFETSLM